MKERNSVKAVLSVFLLMVLVLAGCSSGGREDVGPAASRRDTLVIGVGGSLNLGTGNPVMIQRNACVWETLAVLDDGLVPRPGLAESWEAGDGGRTWTFRLRAGVVFQDGTPLTASLVAANVRRLADHRELDYYNAYRGLVSVEAVDALTVRLFFSRPAPDLPSRLGHYFAGIFSPTAFDAEGRLTKPVGSGPYIFVESKAGRYDMFRAFDRWHGGKPRFERVEFRIIPDPMVRVMSLIRGDIDMIAHQGGIPVSLAGLLEGRPEITVRTAEPAITHYLLFNCGRAPFSDREARAAFAAGLDRDELVGLILKGAGVPARDFFVARAARWNRDRFPAGRERGAAAPKLPETLKARPLVLLINQGDAQSWGYRYTAEYLADVFSRSGLKIDIEILEGGAWSKAVDRGDYDITLYPLSMPTGSPELWIRRLIYSEGMKIRGRGNSTHFHSEEADALFTRAVEAPDASSVEGLFNRILDMAARELPVLPLYHEKYTYAFCSGLTGITVDPFLKIDLAAVRDEGPSGKGKTP